MTIPTLETTNYLHRPEGPEFTFQVGEGTYVLRDDIQLAAPPPHPSEAPVVNPNPLATGPTPPTSGVKLSVVSLSTKRIKPELNKTFTTTSSLLRWKSLGLNNSKESREPEKESRLSTESKSDIGQGEFGSNKPSNAPAFGEGNPALSPLTNKDALKRRKPKSNIVKSNSSFVSRVIPHDSLTKRLAERDIGGTFSFFNINRAFHWLDLSSSSKADPLTKILFTKAHALCHDVNGLTKDAAHIDVVMGTSASDIIWYEPISQKYARINKNGLINGAPISKIKWVPGSENYFLAAHTDGSMIVYDKEKEDAAFVTEEVVDEGISIDEDEQTILSIAKSVNSPNQKTNPVCYWKVSNQSINDFAFSPDNRHLAVVAEDGHLRIIDYLQERLIDKYCSYYGGFTCVCWSPDGKYILTGGQDDLVSIWSLDERQIVARCSGHESWVTAVAFDPWRCDDKTYRFGSIGVDCKLLLWDFSVAMLHRPKAVGGRTRGSISVQSVSFLRNRAESTNLVNRLRSDSNRTQQNVQQPTMEDDAEFVNHIVEPRSRTAQLPPVMSKKIDEHPLTGLAFEQDCILTSCQEGHVKTWDRPREGVNDSQINLSELAKS